jgi:hypothetical protein
MALIATQMEPRRVGRIFFNCRNVAPDPADQRRIERAIKHSIALGCPAEDDTPDILLMAS